MELQTARQIIETLAQGIHPVTGEAMPEDSPYNVPAVIRALFAVAQALDAQDKCRPTRDARSTPPRSGMAWDDEQDAILMEGFHRGDEMKTLADTLGRTRFGVEQRLIKLGKLSAPAGRSNASSAGTARA